MRYLLVVLILLFLTGVSMAEAITSRDFATGYYLEVDNKGAVYALELPEDLYRTVKSAELNDVRVFNGAGELVPHDLRTVSTDPAKLRDKGNIPIFPLYQESNSENLGGFSLQVSRDTAGAIVNISPDPSIDGERQKITGYLLDLSDLEQAVSELEFYWRKEMDSSVFTVKIEQSNDLIRWTTLVHRATLADLQFGGQQVERRTIQLPRKPLKYLKLSWKESQRILGIEEVFGLSRVIETRKRHRWVSLYNGLGHEKKDQLLIDFTTNYRLPTSSVQIRFPETNSIARLAIQSRADSEAGWRTRCEQLFHNLSFEGTTIDNEPCKFQPTADPLWRVVVKQNGAGLRPGNSRISLQLGWQPNELLFVARGTPPYLLAYGSGKVALLDNDPATGMLLQTVKKGSTTEVIGQAGLGKKIVLGGDLALQNPVKPTPWKTWLLWTVLLLGVGLLAYMGRSLTKEMKTADEKRVSEE